VNWAAVFVNALGPIHRGERAGQETLPVVRSRTKKYPLREACKSIFLGRTIEGPVHQNWNLHRIPVVRVVRRRLKSPDKFPVSGFSATTLQVQGLSPGRVCAASTGVGFPVPTNTKFQIGILSSSDPHIAASRTATGSRRWSAVNVHCFAGIGAQRFQHSGNIVKISGDSDQHVIAHNKRRNRCPVTCFTSARTTFHRTVRLSHPGRRGDRQGVNTQNPCTQQRRDGHVQTLVGRIGVMPDLGARPGIDGPKVIGIETYQNAIRHNWRRLNLRGLPGLKGPSEREPTYVRWSNLSQTAVTLAGVVAMINGPTVRRRLQKGIGVEPCANARPLNTAGKTRATARAKKFRPNFILAPPHQRSVPQRRFKLIHSRKASLAQRLQIRQDVVHVFVGVFS